MLRHTFKAAWAHKRRMISTVLSILLGVAFMAGTLVLGDTLDRSFDEMFGEVLLETDAEVRGPVLLDTGFGKLYEPLDGSLAKAVAAVEGVDAVGPFVEVRGVRVLDAEGEPVGAETGPPTLLHSYIEDQALSGIEITEGRAPAAASELMMNVRAARDGGFSVGDPVEVLTVQGVRSFELVGINRIGGRDSALGAVTINVLLPVAQEINDQPGRLTSLSVRADSISPAELVERLEAAIDPDDNLEIDTGQQIAGEMADNVSRGLSFVSRILLVFAFVALVVGAFIIFNTFSVLVAQRGRELALLRALGASRAQVLMSVVVEALAVGAVAAGLGVGAGVVLARAVLSLLDRVGLDLPTGEVIVTAGTVAVALVGGVVVTAASALVPAYRATRVSPLAALRDVAHEDTGRSRLRVAIGIALVVAAGVGAIPAFGPDPDTGSMQLVGVSVFVLLVALIVLGPVIARPLALGLGAPLRRWRGTTGSLARQNAARSPKRTASTAAALMIGVGLVSFIYIFTASARTSIDAELTRGLNAQYIVRATAFDLGLPPSFAADVRQVEGVATVSSVQAWFATVETGDEADEPINTFVSAIDPASHGRVIEATMAEGELADLRRGTVLVDRRIARENGVAMGDTITVTVITGEQRDLTVAAIGDDPMLLGGGWVVTQADWAELMPNVFDAQVYIATEPGADADQVRAEIEELTGAFPTVEVQDRQEYMAGISSRLNMVLNVLLGLLALSVFIALVGIANTLSLSIHERTRELGLLRAVGMARAQVRAAVRWEAVIIALIGTVLGVGLGLVSSYLLVEALKSEGLTRYSVPVGTLLVVAMVFAVLGVLASIVPARRAARLEILGAIAAD